MRVENIMSTEVATARPDTPLKDVARTLVERSISGLPVVDGDGRLLGVVSESDLLPDAHAQRQRPGLLARLRRPPGAEPPPARLAADVMSAPAVAVEPFWSIPGAASLMSTHGVRRLPVTRHGRVVGIVSRADVVRAIARTDAEIQQEVRDLVAFHQGLWSDPLPVDVSVTDGEATLAGEVERRTMAETLPELVGRIPGVLNVRDELTWRDDDRPS